MNEKKITKLSIGVPRERRQNESRVGLTTSAVQLLTADGHPCYIERGAGLGAGFSDDDYAKAGAHIVYSGEEAYGRGDLVLKVSRPTTEELPWMRDGQAVAAFWHLASASPDNLETLLKKKITAIAFEMIQEDDGTLPVLTPMSQVAGRMTANVAAALLRNDRGGKGILLGGVPGVPPAQVVILGAGVVGTYAARAFAALGATVYALDKNITRLEKLNEIEPHIITMISHPFNVSKVVTFADVLVGAVLVPGARTPIVVTKEMVRTMRPRSIIIDVSIDQGGCIETSRPTTHQTSTFIAENIIHYCVPNMTGVLGRTATHSLNNATWPFTLLIMDVGVEAATAQNKALARGVATHNGKIISPSLGGDGVQS